MEVDLYLYAYLRRYAPAVGIGEAIRLDVQDGATVADLLRRVGIPAGTRHVVFVNGLVERGDPPLRAGDRVGVFPPIAGGAGARRPGGHGPPGRQTPR